jgi:ribosomal-protein-alanine N-acetyltransferase
MYVRLMQYRDTAQVSQIDHEAFPTEWPPTNFTRELDNRLAHYIVVSDDKASSPGAVADPTPSRETGGLLGKLKGLLGLGDAGQHPSPAVDEEPILGYAGMWIMADEAHITSIATRGQNRRQGIGEALLAAIIELATRHKARIVTLEVRVSNITAQNLYLKYGFQKTGLRKGYYLDNREDAIIMTTEYIGADSFRDNIRRLKEVHDQKCGQTNYNFEMQKSKRN